MLSFTKQERTVLTLFIVIILSGSILHYVLKRYPAFRDTVNLIDGDKLYSKTNINTASVEELINIPYIGEYTALNIIQYRRQHGPFTAIEQIKNVQGIREKNYAKFYQYLKI